MIVGSSYDRISWENRCVGGRGHYKFVISDVEGSLMRSRADYINTSHHRFIERGVWLHEGTFPAPLMEYGCRKLIPPCQLLDMLSKSMAEVCQEQHSTRHPMRQLRKPTRSRSNTTVSYEYSIIQDHNSCFKQIHSIIL